MDSVASCKALSPTPSPQFDSNAADSSDVPARQSGASIAERRAAKLGFNAARINTARFRTTSPLPSPAARSPCLTIPPGISPTALLDSPIMLPNSQALPSPTTGTFPITSHSQETLMLNSVTPANGDKGSSSFFRFKPPTRPDSLPGFSSFQNQGTNIDYQTLVSAQPLPAFEFPAGFPRETTTNNFSADSSGDVKAVDNIITNNSVDMRVCSSDVAGDQIPRQKAIHGEDIGNHRHSEGDLKETHPLMETVRTSEDGYNWRKYGQKQVKGSEYPRSYYKCTHPNCQVKKKVERSYDGQITEIIYKSNHNHPKPQPSRRASLGSSYSYNDMSEIGEGSGSCVKVEGGAVWRNIQMGSRDTKVSSDWRADGLERTSSTSVLTDLSDPLSNSQVRGVYDLAGTPELSSTLASHDDEEDEATQGSISLADDADEEESDSKRRKTESCLIETNLTSRAIREPRVVVQIESEVDILDDGYRWRKYGQKVVKGNPNPRSYYKCTSAGCSVRKHVERASHDLKCVITTYEGKHNHEVPAARNSSHVNSSGGNIPPSAANAQSTVTLARNNVPKPEAQVQDFASRSSNEYLRSSLLSNFGNDMKFGAANMYQMKLPPLQQSVSYRSFALNPNHSVNHQVGSLASVVPDFPMSLPLSLHQSANSLLPGFDYNNNSAKMGQAESFLSGQQLKESDMRFLRPKQEHEDDNIYDACLPIVDPANASSSPSTSLYGRMMGRFPS